MVMKLGNREARRLVLDRLALAPTPTGHLDLQGLIRQLGFVQLDTIRIVARAHHHILWSRNQNYREPMLDHCLRRDRHVFEHFTHDASLIPIETYPMWQRQFRRMGAAMEGRPWFKGLLDVGERAAIKARIADEGPLCTKAFDTKIVGEPAMWRRPPHKLALDYMWFTGELSTSHRENFIKYYDLSERVIPAPLRAKETTDAAQLDWLCWAALERLGFATPGEIQRFWAAASAAEVKAWVEQAADGLQPVEVECADRTWISALAPIDLAARLDAAEAATTRLRILNPFDPLTRDRDRLKRLFGFDYRIEIFVPAAKRQWGYYVYPLLEGDRFVGRIETRADRKSGQLFVDRLWREPRVKWTAARADKLEAELARLARFVGVDHVVWRTAEVETGV